MTRPIPQNVSSRARSAKHLLHSENSTKDLYKENEKPSVTESTEFRYNQAISSFLNSQGDDLYKDRAPPVHERKRSGRIRSLSSQKHAEKVPRYSRRLLEADSIQDNRSRSRTSTNSGSVYIQPKNPLDLLKQVLVIHHKSIEIEKFNEDVGDLREISRTPQVKVKSRENRPKRTSSGQTKEKVSSRSRNHDKYSREDNGSRDDYAPDSYQPRVPKRKQSKSRNSGNQRYSSDSLADEQPSDPFTRVEGLVTTTVKSRSKSANVSSKPRNRGSVKKDNFSTHDNHLSANDNHLSANEHHVFTNENHHSKLDDPFGQKNSKLQQMMGDNAPSSFSNGAKANDPFDSADPFNSADPFGQGMEPAMDISRVPCPYCERKFAEDRIDKHKKVCLNAQKKKRRIFNASKKRTDREAQQLANQNKKVHQKLEQKKAQQQKMMPKWKRDHLQFQQVLQVGKSTDKLPSSSSGVNISNQESYDDRVECPHCSRKFNPTTAERHIPKCKVMINKPKTLRRGDGLAGGALGNSRHKTQTQTTMKRAFRSQSHQKTLRSRR